MEKSSDLLQKVSRFVVDHVAALITVYNIKTGEYLFVNKAIIKILGYKPESFLKGGVKFASSIVHPEDAPRIMAENQWALKAANNLKNGNRIDDQIVNFEYRMKNRQGEWKWLHTDGSVFSRDKKGMVESVLNISLDITNRKTRELKTNLELIASEHRYKTFLLQSTEGIWRFELKKPISIKMPVEKQITHFYKYAFLAECNDAMAKMYGFKSAKEIEGIRLNDLMPKNDLNNTQYLTSFIVSNYKLNGALSHEVDKNGKPRIMQNNLTGIIENGYVVRAWGTQQDVTKEKILQERLEILESISKKLLVSLDHKIALQEITKLIIPYFADYCRIVTVNEEGVINEIAANHLDPAKVKLVHDLYESYKNISSTYGVGNLLSTGKPEIISKVDMKVLNPYLKNSKLISLIKKIGLKSYMGFPLIARGRIIGAITFSSIKKNRHYTEDDQHFAQILVGRIAMVIDNYRLYAQAQKAITLRDDFISIASHELRTPLTSLKIYSQLLHKNSPLNSDKEKSLTSKMNVQVDKLSRLVGDLLDISKIQTGKLEFKFEYFDLAKCLKGILDDLNNISRKYTFIVKNNLKRKVYADISRIEQVFINLLNNAIKYSPTSDKIIIKIRSDKKVAKISVIDFGIGIDKVHQKKIFERFYRANINDQTTFPGLGIGLYISREIIRRHGGDITFESKKGKGSIFSFTLPLK